MTKLSICIPSYNRVNFLDNCLNSIVLSASNSTLSYEVCISDNFSEENVIPIIKKYENKLNLIFNKNLKNIGLGNNIVKSVSMAKGEFVWILGNDDMMLSNTFSFLDKLFNENLDVDFYYINSYQLEEQVIKNIKYPIDFRKIDIAKLKKFSNYNNSSRLDFFNLIDPLKSYEFMLSMFLCIFRRKYWVENVNVIDSLNILDSELYSNFDNTAPHIKVWAKAFSNKKAFFLHTPLSGNIHGPRGKDWGHLYAFVEGVRIPQVLDCYRKNGLPYLRYILCKNYALRRFIPSFYNMIVKKKHKGLKFINLWNDVIRNLIYPSIYIFGIYFFFRRLFLILKKLI